MLPNPRLGPSGLKLILRSPETTNFFFQPSLIFFRYRPLQKYDCFEKLTKSTINSWKTLSMDKVLRTFYRKTTKIATSDNNSVPPPPPPKKNLKLRLDACYWSRMFWSQNVVVFSNWSEVKGKKLKQDLVVVACPFQASLTFVLHLYRWHACKQIVF